MRHFELGYQSYQERRIREAVEHFRLGLASGEDPEGAARDRWMTMMLAGEFEDAWQESDRVMARRKLTGETCRHLPPHMRFVWNGESLAGRNVLVRCYHGLGDVIQFIRYTSVLKQICRRVTVRPQPELLELLEGASGIDALLSPGDPDPEFDLDIELLEIPHALRTTVATIPANIPYLAADPSRVIAKGNELAGETRFRIGLAWASGAWMPERSIPLSRFSFLRELPDIAVIGLQRGPAVDEMLEGTGPAFVCSDWTNNSVADTAATMLNLDLVISTDTMVAHLAGALGVPAWTLLHSNADWRWMVDRNDSPWYPGMRLFRQARQGDWGILMEQVRAGLIDRPCSKNRKNSGYQREGLRP